MKEASVPPPIDLDAVRVLRSTLRTTKTRLAEHVPVSVRTRRAHSWQALLAADTAGLVGALALAAALVPSAAVPVWIALPPALALFAAFGLYDPRRLASASSEALAVLKAVSVAAAGGAVAAPALPRTSLLALWAGTIACTGALRALVRKARSLHPTGILVVGRSADALALGRALGRGRWSGYSMVGFVEPRRSGVEVLDGLHMVGTTDRMADAIARTGAGAVIVVASALSSAMVDDVYHQVRDAGIECWVTALPPRLAPWRIRHNDLDGTPVLGLGNGRTHAPRRFAKRVFDIAGAGAVLALSAPVFAAIAAAIKIDDPSGPVFFRQTRVGKDGRRFHLVKFRTMFDNAEQRLEEMKEHNEADGLLFKMRDDPRITRVGRFLRRTSLDELPQLWNVVVGDMSLVGPRPALPEETDRYEGRLAARLRVKPGMTGLWQVSGRQTLSWADYVHYDLYYAENWSVSLDVAILARTLPAVLRGRGAW